MDDNASPLASNLMVNRKPPEMILPMEPTPHEFKPLSDIDDQPILRFLVPGIHFYSANSDMTRQDPVGVIREAISKALVYYYPLAGRLRQVSDGNKLAVECTGEGVLFIEADADATLNEFGDLRPPFIGIDNLLVPNSYYGITNCPLLFIQATRLKCGGFILSWCVNHTMCDAYGIFQFLIAVSELARGFEAPTLLPVWERHIFNAREKPRVTHGHPEYECVESNSTPPFPPFSNGVDMVERTFLFARDDIAAVRSHLPPHLHNCSTLDILLACIWRSRTIAISHDDDDEVRIIYPVTARSRFNPPVPQGYYGNAFAMCAVIARAGNLLRKPLHYAIELLKENKHTVTEEYMKSLADFMVTRDRPQLMLSKAFILADNTRTEFQQVDFGWGKAIYAGVATVRLGQLEGMCSFCIGSNNEKGDSRIMVPMCLPPKAMEIFTK